MSIIARRVRHGWTTIAIGGVLGTALCIAGVAPLTAQATEPTPVERSAGPWTATLFYGAERFDSDLPAWSAWQRWGGRVQRDLARGSLALEVFRERRFDMWDHAGVVDGYVRLWPRAYANLRVQVSPDPHALPEMDVAGEYFHDIGRGWELSAAARVMEFTSGSVDLYSLGAGHYVGNWYLNARGTVAPDDEGAAWSGRALMRRYGADADEFIEVGAGYGQEPVTIAGGAFDLRTTWSVSGRGQRFTSAGPGLGLRIGATGFEGAPWRMGAELSVIVRW